MKHNEVILEFVNVKKHILEFEYLDSECMSQNSDFLRNISLFLFVIKTNV